MAIVVDKARPAATTTPDGSIRFAASVADEEIETLRSHGTINILVFPASDDRGGNDQNDVLDTTVDFDLAGTDLSR